VFDNIDLFKEIKILLLLALLSYFGPKLQGNCARAQYGLGSFVYFFFDVGFRQKLLYKLHAAATFCKASRLYRCGVCNHCNPQKEDKTFGQNEGKVGGAVSDGPT
jgi:hypothetical protein